MPDIACIGRYWPGDSPVHRMDARAKLLLSLAVMAIAFVAQTFAALGVVALFTVALFALSGIPLRSALRSIVPLLFIVVITALLNVLFVHTGDVVFQWWVITVTTGGIRMAAFIALRLTVLLLAMSLLTLTTPTLDITDAFEYLLAPFRRFGLPAHELSMMMGLALRFMPLFVGELTTIYRAQVSRGAVLSKWRVSTLTSLLVPLFTSAFRHAEMLSAAMDARCYHGAEGRTRLHPLRYTSLDRKGALAVAALLACTVAANFLPF